MSTWRMDTALVKLSASQGAAPPQRCRAAKKAKLFPSAVSLTKIIGSIGKIPPGPAQRAQALRNWLNGLTTSFADRIKSVNAAIATRAGGLLRNQTSNSARRSLHDAILVATAQAYGRGLLTRRDTTFCLWTQTPIAVV